MSYSPNIGTNAFLITWLFEHLAGQGLIDGRQLAADMQALMQTPMNDMEQAGLETWLRTFVDLGVVPPECVEL